MHVSDLSWEENSEAELKNYEVGSKVKAKVLSAEPEKERISLGIKQLTDNPKADSVSAFKKVLLLHVSFQLLTMTASKLL